MKVFVLDNSLRESTVGQVVGHSSADKIEILKATKECGFRHQIVGAFSAGRRVDDAFASALRERTKETSSYNHSFYAFSDICDTIENNRMLIGEDHIPIGLAKMKQYGIPNAIIEIDLANKDIDWGGSFPVSKALEHLTFLLQWSNENLPPPSCEKRMNFVNLRDFPVAMLECPERVVEFVRGIATMPSSYRPVGITQEEPMGEFFPEEVAAWNQEIRDTMDNNGWPSLFQKDGTTLDGLLLSHVHKQWGLGDAVVLDVLAAGADGIWCSICEEGASMGHASSCVTLANLARLGNKDVVSRYQTRNLAQAARSVTKITTNKDVSPRQIVYGPRAIETVFGFSGIAGGATDESFDKNDDGVIDEVDHFSLAKFLGVDDPPIRINTLSSPALVVSRLKQCFGDDPAFTEEIAEKMLAAMKLELIDDYESEHTSPMGISLLWRNATGSFHPKMVEYENDLEMEKLQVRTEHFLQEAKDCYFNNMEEGRDHMDYNHFYHAYLQQYFGCFACPTTRFVLDAIDLNEDGELPWTEWRFWCLWALRQYPNEIANLDDLHSVVLRNAILPLSLEESKVRGGNYCSIDV